MEGGSQGRAEGSGCEARQFVSQAKPFSADIYSIFYKEIGRGERRRRQFTATSVNIFLPSAHVRLPSSQLGGVILRF